MLGRRVLFLLIIPFFVFGGCEGKGDGTVKARYLPSSSGQIDEVVLVMDDFQWKSETGDAVRNLFMQDYNVLPQSEPIFDLRQVAPENLHDLLKNAATILFVGSFDKGSTGKLISRHLNNKTGEKPYAMRTNVWAKPQRLLYVFGNTERKLIASLRQHERVLLNALAKVETDKALTNALLPGESLGFSKMLNDDFKLQLKIPNNFVEVMRNDTFVWFRQDAQMAEEIVNLIVYQKPYAASNKPDLDASYPIAMRNEVGKNISSEVEGSYMVSDSSYLEYTRQWVKPKDLKMMEARGLWSMEKDFMGGPFINYTFDDPANNRIVMIDGFVYAPRSKKRPIMRKLSALMQGVSVLP